MNETVKIYHYGIHTGEESFVYGNDASGIIYFSGCHLRCQSCYCPEVASGKEGEDYRASEFYMILDRLVMKGAKNINLISPTVAWDFIYPILKRWKEHNTLADALPMTIIAKTSGLEDEKMIREMASVCSLLIPDLKAITPSVLSAENLPNYYNDIAVGSIALADQLRSSRWRDQKLSSGVIVRHLILPHAAQECVNVLKVLESMHFQGHINLMTNYIDPKTKALKKMDLNDLKNLLTGNFFLEKFPLNLWVNGKKLELTTLSHSSQMRPFEKR